MLQKHWPNEVCARSAKVSCAWTSCACVSDAAPFAWQKGYQTLLAAKIAALGSAKRAAAAATPATS
eukprot:330491-Alexandrium_andersonii.AAC.1